MHEATEWRTWKSSDHLGKVKYSRNLCCFHALTYKKWFWQGLILDSYNKKFNKVAKFRIDTKSHNPVSFMLTRTRKICKEIYHPVHRQSHTSTPRWLHSVWRSATLCLVYTTSAMLIVAAEQGTSCLVRMQCIFDFCQAKRHLYHTVRDICGYNCCGAESVGR